MLFLIDIIPYFDLIVALECFESMSFNYFHNTKWWVFNDEMTPIAPPRSTRPLGKSPLTLNFFARNNWRYNDWQNWTTVKTIEKMTRQFYFGFLASYRLGEENEDSTKNMILLKNPQFSSNHYETLTQ